MAATAGGVSLRGRLGSSAANLTLGRREVGLSLLLACSSATALLGLAYVVLAMTITMLPADASFLGIRASQLCTLDHCRLLEFLAHGRMSYGGSLIGVGVLTGWLAVGPLRQGLQWAWWAMLLAGLAAYGSSLALLAYGYLDVSYLLVIVLVSALCFTGLALTKPEHTSLIDSFRSPHPTPWMQDSRGKGRLMTFALAFGIGPSGVAILIIASSVVFVPQDTAFLEMSSHDVSKVSDHLKPLMAHDRAGYGGAMTAIGILLAAIAWRGLGPDSRGAWRAVAISVFTFYGTTLAIHLAIGYTSLIHLLPVYGGLIFLTIALALLRGKPRQGQPVDRRLRPRSSSRR